MSQKTKIRLRAKHLSGRLHLIAACPVSEALFELIKNRSTIFPVELPLLVRMGFEIEYSGDLRELKEEKEREGVNV
jgi:hypothetical protein